VFGIVRSLKDSFSGFGTELLGYFKESHNSRLDDAAFEERVIGINKAIAVICEANVQNEEITRVMQNIWIYVLVK